MFLFVVPLVLYSGTLRYPLVFDDAVLQESNLRLYGDAWRSLGLRWVAYATFGWTYRLAGLDWFWYRLSNVALHALTVVALFFFLRRLFEAVLAPQAAGDGAALKPGQLAFFGALIFALHPVSVYGAVYLTERSIVMATLFGVLSLHAFLEAMLGGRSRWFAVSAALYFLAVFSKEHCVMLPAVAAAMALLRGKPSRSLVGKLWPAFAMYLPIAALVVLKARGLLGTAYEPFSGQAIAHLSASALPDGGATAFHDWSVGQARSPADLDPGALYALSVMTQCWLFFKYLFLWLVPDPAWMSVDLRQKFAAGFLSWPETAGLLAFIAYPFAAAGLLLKGGLKGLAGLGLLFPWLLFLTELSTVRIQEPFVLYRSYLWATGLTLLVPLIRPPVGAGWRAALLGSICLLLVPLALNRLHSFSSEWTLWNDVVEKNADRTLFLAERGYNKRGIAELKMGDYPAAIRDFSASLDIHRADANIYLNRGMASMQLGHFSDALRDFAVGLRIDPGEPDFHVNRGIIYAAGRRYSEAIAEFDRAIDLNSSDAVAYFNRGQTLRLMSRFDEGTASLGKSCALGYPPACAALSAPR